MNDPIRIGSRKCKECGKRGQCYKRPDHDEQLCRGCLPVAIPENRGKHRNRATQTAALLKHRNTDMTAAIKSRSMAHRIVPGQSIKKTKKKRPKFDRSLFQPISSFRNHLTHIKKSGLCAACSGRLPVLEAALIIPSSIHTEKVPSVVCRSCAEGQ